MVILIPARPPYLTNFTGARQRVGNWAGVTVERKEGQFATTDHRVTLVDLPGTYSLTTISSQTSLDEQIACHYILSGDADLLINVVDASNLERNLYLTLQLLELGIPCIVALNMLDIAENSRFVLMSTLCPRVWVALSYRWYRLAVAVSRR